MTTWEEYRKTITAIPQEELRAMSRLTQIYANRVKQGRPVAELGRLANGNIKFDDYLAEQMKDPEFRAEFEQASKELDQELEED